MPSVIKIPEIHADCGLYAEWCLRLATKSLVLETNEECGTTSESIRKMILKGGDNIRWLSHDDRLGSDCRLHKQIIEYFHLLQEAGQEVVEAAGGRPIRI